VVVAVAVILASAIGVVSCGSSPPKKAVSTVTSTTATLATTGPEGGHHHNGCDVIVDADSGRCC
jgi:FlaG/FlaF family flagellin (archaellin)